jgi:hypothetical protein
MNTIDRLRTAIRLKFRFGFSWKEAWEIAGRYQ